jgi:PAT family acetyl-CoA transporter-like MFS transporter 1
VYSPLLIFAGWALTLLSAPNLSYASTAQTIGLGIGNALAFTVFLAFNSVDFSQVFVIPGTDPAI